MKILLFSGNTAVEPYAVDALGLDHVAGVLARSLSGIDRRRSNGG